MALKRSLAVRLGLPLGWSDRLEHWTHHLSTYARCGTHLSAARNQPRPCPTALDAAPAIASPFLCLLRRRRAPMSSSSASQSRWPKYGAVPLTRCPKSPRPEPLKRWVTKTDENGNLGREFVKCPNKTQEGRDGKVRSQFFRIQLL